jgi:hypothetical protein
MSAQAISAEGVPTRFRASYRVLRRVVHTYATLEQPLGGLGKFSTLCDERTVFSIELFLETKCIGKTVIGKTVVIKEWRWSLWATRGIT